MSGESECAPSEPPGPLSHWNLPAAEAGPASQVCNSCSCTGPCAQKGPVLRLMFYFCHFEIINNF